MAIKNTNGFCQLNSFVFLYKLILLFNCWEPLWFSCWIMTWRHCAIALQWRGWWPRKQLCKGSWTVRNRFPSVSTQLAISPRWLATAACKGWAAPVGFAISTAGPRQFFAVSAAQRQQSLNFATLHQEALEPHLNLWEKARKVRGCKKPRLVARGEG